MALRWDWNEKCGEAFEVQKLKNEDGVDIEHHFKLNLYTGNACLIMLYEFEDDDGETRYSLANFWADKEHMKNCLGLNKKQGYTENIHNKPWDRFVKFRLNKNKCRYINDIVPALVKAFDNIEIEIYTD